MVDVTLVLVPLLVLPIVLLFRFIGCGYDGVATGVFPTTPPNYRDYIMSNPNATAPGTVRAHPEVHPNVNDVVAYWRLVDPKPSDDPHGDHSGKAKDERGDHDGTYFRGAVVYEEPHLMAIPPILGSEGSPQQGEDILRGQDSLIDSDPLHKCPLFSGGFVEVPDQDENNSLYPQEFTIEAWVCPQWGPNTATGFEHTLFSAEGFYRKPFDPGGPSWHGFAVITDAPGNWRVRFPGGPELVGVSGSAQKVRTHLAVTVTSEQGQSRVRLFLNGKPAGQSGLVFYSPPTGAPLHIGVGNKQPNPTQTVVATRPVISLIQEVVLYSKALSAAEIENHVDINRIA